VTEGRGGVFRVEFGGPVFFFPHICRHPTTIRYARGPCFCKSFSFSDLFEPPEEGKGIGFPLKHVILADCTT